MKEPVSDAEEIRPNSNASRGRISKIVSNAARYSDTPSGQTFEDVPTTGSFYTWAERLASGSIMGGYACDRSGRAENKFIVLTVRHHGTILGL